ncbi:MAG TPA: TerC family protein [Steroidobacteraceae bacterium]|nr:TerC family protein [Steroidobacteraceae bacterium]
MELLFDVHAWIAFFTLAALEIVLGVDNIIVLSVLVSRLPKDRQPNARRFGLALAMLTRIALLFSITWLTRLTTPLFETFDRQISARDLVLFAGGLFLLAKAVSEIHATFEGSGHKQPSSLHSGFVAVIVQIALIDIVFSLDSVFTAVGLSNQLPIMVAAIVASVIVMMWLAGPLNDFIEKYPTIKIIALAFLILVGVLLMAEGADYHIERGYLYFAMAFSVVVEMLNIKLRRLLNGRASRREDSEEKD